MGGAGGSGGGGLGGGGDGDIGKQKQKLTWAETPAGHVDATSVTSRLGRLSMRRNAI